MHLILVFALVACTVSQGFRPNTGNNNQLQCGFTCTRQSQFTVSIDGTQTTAKCTDSNADPRVRCEGCCAASALAAGLSAVDAAGFPSTNGRDCICCINNYRC